MSSATAVPVERLADHFVTYLFEKYHGTRHVRRVATWIGFILKAIERASGGSLQRNRTRQLTFDYRNRRFKAKYNHQAGNRGGFDIVEVLPAQGSPEGGLAVRVTDLNEAEEVYRSLEQQLDRYCGV